jgi:hypothetical protein
MAVYCRFCLVLQARMAYTPLPVALLPGWCYATAVCMWLPCSSSPQQQQSSQELSLTAAAAAAVAAVTEVDYSHISPPLMHPACMPTCRTST